MADANAALPDALELRRASSGLEDFRQILHDGRPLPPMVALLGIELAEVDEGRVVFTARASERFYNGLGVAHGGFAATLLDSALGCAISTALPAGRVMTTLELKVNYTRPIRQETGALRCEARVIHLGSRTATSEGRVVDGDGRIYAHGTTTCIVLEAGPHA